MCGEWASRDLRELLEQELREKTLEQTGKKGAGGAARGDGRGHDRGHREVEALRLERAHEPSDAVTRSHQDPTAQASLGVQWLKILLPMPGTRVPPLAWENCTCHGTVLPVCRNP